MLFIESKYPFPTNTKQVPLWLACLIVNWSEHFNKKDGKKKKGSELEKLVPGCNQKKNMFFLTWSANRDDNSDCHILQVGKKDGHSSRMLIVFYVSLSLKVGLCLQSSQVINAISHTVYFHCALCSTLRWWHILDYTNKSGGSLHSTKVPRVLSWTTSRTGANLLEKGNRSIIKWHAVPFTSTQPLSGYFSLIATLLFWFTLNNLINRDSSSTR